MICDNCGEEIKKAVIQRPDGEVWCYKCAKAEKSLKRVRKVARTKDKFVRVARRIHGVQRSDYYGIDRVMLSSGKGRAYTNGHVLLSETTIMPRDYRLIDLDSLWTSEEVKPPNYPDIEKITSRGLPNGVAVNIPTEFYDCIKVFTKPKLRQMQVNAVFGMDGIDITDTRDGSFLHYGEVKPGLEDSVTFDLGYINAIKPKSLLIDGSDNPAWVLESYEEGLESCVISVVMPMIKD